MSKRRTLKKIGYKNKSKYFLPLMLDLKISSDEFLIDVNFIQSGFPQAVLIFDNNDEALLREDIYRLSLSPYFVISEFGDDNKEVCLFFDIPKTERENFKYFVNGQYTRFSPSLKEKIIKKHGMYREKGLSEDSGLPRVSPYDAICPSPATLAKFQKFFDTDEQIKEVLSPPDLEYEEFKEADELDKNQTINTKVL